MDALDLIARAVVFGPLLLAVAAVVIVAAEARP